MLSNLCISRQQYSHGNLSETSYTRTRKHWCCSVSVARKKLSLILFPNGFYLKVIHICLRLITQGATQDWKKLKICSCSSHVYTGYFNSNSYSRSLSYRVVHFFIRQGADLITVRLNKSPHLWVKVALCLLCIHPQHDCGYTLLEYSEKLCKESCVVLFCKRSLHFHLYIFRCSVSIPAWSPLSLYRSYRDKLLCNACKLFGC